MWLSSLQLRLLVSCVILYYSCAFLGSSWVSSGPPWGHLGAILGHPGAIPGPSWPSWGHLGPSWGHLGPSWGHLGAILGHLGAILGPSWAILGPSCPEQVDFQRPHPGLAECAQRWNNKNVLFRFQVQEGLERVRASRKAGAETDFFLLLSPPRRAKDGQERSKMPSKSHLVALKPHLARHLRLRTASRGLEDAS